MLLYLLLIGIRETSDISLLRRGVVHAQKKVFKNIILHELLVRSLARSLLLLLRSRITLKLVILGLVNGGPLGRLLLVGISAAVGVLARHGVGYVARGELHILLGRVLHLLLLRLRLRYDAAQLVVLRVLVSIKQYLVGLLDLA